MTGRLLALYFEMEAVSKLLVESHTKALLPSRGGVCPKDLLRRARRFALEASRAQDALAGYLADLEKFDNNPEDPDQPVEQEILEPGDFSSGDFW